MIDLEYVRASIAAEQLTHAIEFLKQAQHSLAVTDGCTRASDATLEALQGARVAAELTAVALRALARR